MNNIVSCYNCFAGIKNGVKCILCRGTGTLKKMKVKTSPTTDWEVLVPSNLSQEDAQIEYEDSIKILSKNFKLDN